MIRIQKTTYASILANSPSPAFADTRLGTAETAYFCHSWDDYAAFVEELKSQPLPVFARRDYPHEKPLDSLRKNALIIMEPDGKTPREIYWPDEDLLFDMDPSFVDYLDWYQPPAFRLRPRKHEMEEEEAEPATPEECREMIESHFADAARRAKCKYKATMAYLSSKRDKALSALEPAQPSPSPTDNDIDYEDGISPQERAALILALSRQRRTE